MALSLGTERRRAALNTLRRVFETTVSTREARELYDRLIHGGDKIVICHLSFVIGRLLLTNDE